MSIRNTYFLFVFLIFSISGIVLSQTGLESQDKKALKELEQQVNELKENVYRSKVRLRELEEAVLKGRITGAKAFIDFENRAEGFFTLSSAEFYLDDELVRRIEAKGRKSPIKQIRVFDGDVPSGEHTLTAKLFYRGSDKSFYKTFSYFKDHQFELQTKEKFNVEYGKTTVIKMVALDKGYFKGDVKGGIIVNGSCDQKWLFH